MRPLTDFDLFGDIDRLRLHADNTLSEDHHFCSYDVQEMAHPVKYSVLGFVVPSAPQ